MNLPNQANASTSSTVTEAELLVRRSDEFLTQFDAQRIAEALIRETNLPSDIATQISLSVRDQIKNLGLKTLTAPLIRGLVDAKLLEMGLAQAHRLHSRLGVPMFDADQIIQGTSPELRSAHGPEGTSLALAESIKREYAMLSVFSEMVSNAHLAGDLHIGNIGEVDRLTTMIGSIDFIKRNGIVLPGGFAGSRPARRPEVLASHLVKYTAALHGYFSEAIAWDSVNFAFAPFLVDLSHEERKQIAQALLFDLSTPAIARGGQPMRCDLHLDWDAPAYLKNLPAIGAGGEQLDKTYDEFGEVARDFLTALFEVYLEGDGQGWPLTGPRPILHVTSRFIDNPGYRNFLDLVSRVAIERGGVTFSFDRSPEDDAAMQTFTNRYGINANALQRANQSWQWRAAVLSAVSINLPRLGLKAGGDQLAALELLTELLELAAQASLEKRVFIEKLLARGEAGVMSLLAMRPNNELFLRLSWTAHAICPIGLHELAKIVVGEDLEKSTVAQEFGKKIIAHLHAEMERLSAKHKVRFILAEARDVVAQHRLAKLDQNKFPQAVNAQQQEVFYSNATKLPATAQVNAVERLRVEGIFQESANFRMTSELWDSEIPTSPDQIAVLISRAFYQTNCAAFILSSEFTLCAQCHTATRGSLAACPNCDSTKIDILAQAGNHYSRVSTWSPWKVTELQLRKRKTMP